MAFFLYHCIMDLFPTQGQFMIAGQGEQTETKFKMQKARNRKDTGNRLEFK